MGKQSVLREEALAEITLRKYERPGTLKGRDLVKKVMLSIGLLQPGDSRDVIVDIFYVLYKEKKALSCSEIEEKVIENRKKNGLPLLGVAGSNIRRQLRRLKELFLIEVRKNKYKISDKEEMLEIFEEKIEQYYINSIIKRVKDYFKQLK